MLIMLILSKNTFWIELIYIIEFKINQSAKKATKQIKDKKYAEKYSDDKRPIHLLGINFDTEKNVLMIILLRS